MFFFNVLTQELQIVYNGNETRVYFLFTHKSSGICCLGRTSQLSVSFNGHFIETYF